jgi:hypothetical protein
VKYQLDKALHRYEYCLLFYDGTGNPFTTGPGMTNANIICNSMNPQYTNTDDNVGSAF